MKFNRNSSWSLIVKLFVARIYFAVAAYKGYVGDISRGRIAVKKDLRMK